LYLPQGWLADDARGRQAGVPAATTFRTKPQLAQAMLERALDAGVPAAWVTGAAVSGSDRRRRLWLEARAMPQVLAIKSTASLWAATDHGPAQVAAATVAGPLPVEAWPRLSAGDGATGPRRDDWARVALRPLGAPDWGYGLMVRRSLVDRTDLAYSGCVCPVATPLRDRVRVAGRRWAIEESIETAKGAVGLDHYEVRRWDGWYRHITLALLAHAFRTVTHAQAATTEDTKGGRSLR